MKAFGKTTRNLVLCFTFFVLSVLAAVYTYYYVDKEGKELGSQMEILSKNKQLQERYNSLQIMVDESQAEYQELSSYLLTENNTIHFLSDIETLAGGMGLQLTTDALKVDPLSNPKYQGITLQLRATGKYDRVVNFLEVLETLPYYSRIEALQLAKDGRNGDVWTASVTLLVGLHDKDEVQ